MVLELWQFPFIRDWPEIQKSDIPLPEFCPIPGDWWKIRNTKFGTNVSNKMLLNPAKYQGYSFYRFWVIKEKPTTRAGVKLPHPPFLPPRLGLIFQDSSCSGRTWEIWCLYGGTLNLGEHHKTSSRSILR